MALMSWTRVANFKSPDLFEPAFEAITSAARRFAISPSANVFRTSLAGSHLTDLDLACFDRTTGRMLFDRLYSLLSSANQVTALCNRCAVDAHTRF
jgi:hypothetical protein